MPIVNGNSGSSPATLSRAIYDTPSAATDVAQGTRTPLSFGTLSSGDTILDLSVPTKPTVVEEGVYAVTVTVNFVVEPTTPGGLQIDLEMDVDGEDADTLSQVPTGGSSGSYNAVSCVYYVPAGGAITVNIRQFYVAHQDFGINVVIQRVA